MRRRRRICIGLRWASECTNARTICPCGSCDGLCNGRHRVHRRTRRATCVPIRPRAGYIPGGGPAHTPGGHGRGAGAGRRARPGRAPARLPRLRDRLSLRRIRGLPPRRPGLARERALAADRRGGRGRRGGAPGGGDLERGRHRPGTARRDRHRGRLLPGRRARALLSGREARGRGGGARRRHAHGRGGRDREPVVRVRGARGPHASGGDLHPDDRQLPSRPAAGDRGRGDERRRRARRGEGASPRGRARQAGRALRAGRPRHALGRAVRARRRALGRPPPAARAAARGGHRGAHRGGGGRARADLRRGPGAHGAELALLVARRRAASWATAPGRSTARSPTRSTGTAS